MTCSSKTAAHHYDDGPTNKKHSTHSRNLIKKRRRYYRMSILLATLIGCGHREAVKLNASHESCRNKPPLPYLNKKVRSKQHKWYKKITLHHKPIKKNLHTHVALYTRRWVRVYGRHISTIRTNVICDKRIKGKCSIV